MRPRLRFLSDELIERILDEAYKLLETKGVTLHHESLPRRLAEAGCILDADSKTLDAQICDITRWLAAGLEPREDFPAADLFDQLLRERFQDQLLEHSTVDLRALCRLQKAMASSGCVDAVYGGGYF